MAERERPGNILDPAAGEMTVEETPASGAGELKPADHKQSTVEVDDQLGETDPIAVQQAPTNAADADKVATDRPAPTRKQPRSGSLTPPSSRVSSSRPLASAQATGAPPYRGQTSTGGPANATDQPPSAEPDEQRPASWGRPPLWIWILGGLIALAILLLVQDLRNRDRYLLVCTSRGLELHQGRRLPWPFGHSPLGGAELRPVAQAAPEDCAARSFDSELAAREAFLEALLGRARAHLSAAKETELEQVRREVQQALRLSEELPHRRREVEHLLALVSYQEGKVGLQRAERALRSALSRFQEAEKLSADRFDDLEEWITHLEEMLRALSPSPFGATSPPPGPLPPSAQQPIARPNLPPAPQSPGDGLGPEAASDAGPSEPSNDGGLPASASGILM